MDPDRKSWMSNISNTLRALGLGAGIDRWLVIPCRRKYRLRLRLMMSMENDCDLIKCRSKYTSLLFLKALRADLLKSQPYYPRYYSRVVSRWEYRSALTRTCPHPSRRRSAGLAGRSRADDVRRKQRYLMNTMAPPWPLGQPWGLVPML